MKPQIIGADTIRGSLYIVTCRRTHKSYIGITRMVALKRWQAHLRLSRKGSRAALHNAMRKYGASNFDFRVLAVIGNWDSLCALEKHAIVAFNTRSPFGYNLTEGGDGAPGLDPELIREGLRRSPTPPMTEAQKLAIGNRSKLFWSDEENRRRVAEAHSRKWSDPEHCDRHRAAISAAFNTEQERKARSERAKALWANPSYRAAVYKRATAATRTAENRKAQSDRIKAMWADPAKRAKMMARRKVNGDAPTNNL